MNDNQLTESSITLFNDTNKYSFLNNRKTSLNNILIYFKGWNKNIFNNVLFNNTQSDKIEYLKAVQKKCGKNFDLNKSRIALLDQYYKAIDLQNINSNINKIFPMSCISHNKTKKLLDSFPSRFGTAVKSDIQNVQNYNPLPLFVDYFRENPPNNKFKFDQITDIFFNLEYTFNANNQIKKSSHNKIQFSDGKHGIERCTLKDDNVYYEIFKFKEDFNVPSLINFLEQWNLSHKLENNNKNTKLTKKEKSISL